jgi:hypothetical protein
MTARLVRARTRPGRRCEHGQAFAAGRPSVMQDGRAWAIHDGVREGVPGRCQGGKPAAVARHTPLALRGAAPTTGGLPPALPRAQAF